MSELFTARCKGKVLLNASAESCKQPINFTHTGGINDAIEKNRQLESKGLQQGEMVINRDLRLIDDGTDYCS